MNIKIIVTAALAASLGAASAPAAVLSPSSYDMFNGGSGSFTYRDDSYSGSGNPNANYAALTGGLGDLTDGVIASQNWFSQPSAYVGWQNTFVANPTITFRWVSAVDIDSVTLYLDDSNGAGGVSPPSSVDIAGTNFAVSDPASGAPFAFTVSGLGFSGTELNLRLNHQAQWLMLSEVRFEGEAMVPEPGTLALAGMALLATCATRRRRTLLRAL